MSYRINQRHGLRWIYINICHSIIYNSRDLEKPHKFKDGDWLNKLWYIYTL